jgi:hypothetical protein
MHMHMHMHMHAQAPHALACVHVFAPARQLRVVSLTCARRLANASYVDPAIRL